MAALLGRFASANAAAAAAASAAGLALQGGDAATASLLQAAACTAASAAAQLLRPPRQEAELSMLAREEMVRALIQSSIDGRLGSLVQTVDGQFAVKEYLEVKDLDVKNHGCVRIPTLATASVQSSAYPVCIRRCPFRGRWRSQRLFAHGSILGHTAARRRGCCFNCFSSPRRRGNRP